MEVNNFVKGKLVIEVTDVGISCDCRMSGTVFGKALVFDAFCKAMKMYNPIDQISMLAIITEGGLEGVLKDKADITVIDMSKFADMVKGDHSDET